MKKLHSKKGATLLLALLLLLASTMVSTVILTAVTSVSKNIRDDRQMQQDYLTVSSAAEFLRDNIAGDSCKFTKTEKKSCYGNSTVTYDHTPHTGLFKDWLDECVDYNKSSTNYSQFEGEFSDNMTINVESDLGDVEFSEVKAEFSFVKSGDKAGSLTITLSSGECTMYVIFTCTRVVGDPTTSGEWYNEQTVTETTITWSKGKISRTAEGVSGNS